MRAFVWYWPMVLAGVGTAMYLLSPLKPDVFGINGLFHGLSQVLIVLPGFYIAALAAVASLSNSGLDEDLGSDAPSVTMEIRDKSVPVTLTRRKFLLLAIAYVSVLSLLLLVTGVVLAYGFDPNTMAAIFPMIVLLGLNTLTLAVFLYFFASLISTTVHIVYFLAEGAHLPV